MDNQRNGTFPSQKSKQRNEREKRNNMGAAG